MKRDASEDSVAIPYDQLRDFVVSTFVAYNLDESAAWQAAEVLVQSDLRGIDSHGVVRLPHYVNELHEGRINPRPQMHSVREAAGTAHVDGDNGLGLVIGPQAFRKAMDKADEVGTGWVSVSNSNHFGFAGYYPLQALPREQIGIAMTAAPPSVAPLWGGESMLGTNPIAIAFPGKQFGPIVIDMATSTITFGEVEMARLRGRDLDHGWALDPQGLPTTDPRAFLQGGAIVPLGGDRAHGGHKGYCLAAMVDLLSSVLSGANWGPFVPAWIPGWQSRPQRVGKGIGHFFGSWRIDAFAEPEEVRERVDQWITVLRQTRPEPGTDGPLIPGDPEREAEVAYRRDGIPLLRSVYERLSELGQNVGVALD